MVMLNYSKQCKSYSYEKTQSKRYVNHDMKRDVCTIILKDLFTFQSDE